MKNLKYLQYTLSLKNWQITLLLSAAVIVILSVLVFFVQNLLLKIEYSYTYSLYIALISSILFAVPIQVILIAFRNKNDNNFGYQALVETAKVATIITDEKHKILYANPASESIFGYSSQELSNLFINEIILDYLDPLNTDNKLQIPDEVNEAGMTTFYGLHESGRWIPLEITNSRFFDNTLARYTLYIRDVSDEIEAKKSLLKELNLVQALTDRIPTPIYYKDRYGKFIGWNIAFEKNLGLQKTQILNKTAHEIFDRTIAEILIQLDKTIFDTGKDQSQNINFLFSDGIEHEVIVHEAPYTTVDGKLSGIVGTIIDIHEVKKTEEALRQSEEHFRAIYENSAIAIARVTLDRKVIDCNPVFVKFLLYSEKELKQIFVRDFTYVEDLKTDEFLYNDLLKGKINSYNLEKRYIKKDGAIVWGRLNMSIVKDGRNKPLFSIAMVEDVTQHKQIEKALQEREEYFRQMFEKHSAAKLLIEPETGAIIKANPAACKFYGYSMEAITTMTFSDINVPLNQFVNDEMAQLGDGQNNYYLYKHKLSSGEIRDVEVYSIPLKRHGQTLLYSIVHDITERKMAEEALKKSEEKWRSLVEHAPDTIANVDKNKTIRFINREARDFDKEFVGATIFDFIEPEYHEIVKKTCDYVFETAKSSSYEVASKKSTGEISWYSTRVSPIVYDDEVISLTLIATNITERKQAEEAFRESETKLSKIASNLPGLIYQATFKNDKAEFLYISEGSYDLLGIKPEDIIKNSQLFFDAILPIDLPSVQQSIHKAKDSKENWIKDFRMFSKAGEIIWARGVASASNQLEEKEVWNGVLLDITYQKITEEELQLASIVYENTVEAILITDSSGFIQSVNKAFTTITGYAENEVLGKRANFFEPGKHENNAFQTMWDELMETGKWTGEFWNYRKNGIKYPEQVSLTVVKDESQSVIHFVAVFSDITERKQHENYIQYHAYHDVLTDLPNRKLFYDQLIKAIAQNNRSKEIIAVLFIDLDGFKGVNDSWGHIMGDELLKQVAVKLKSCTRIGDTVARLGGDEFTLILPQLKDIQDCRTIANKILTAFHKPFFIEGKELTIGTSIGISIHPDDSDDPDELLRKADDAMYIVKLQGKNNFLLYSEEVKNAKGSLRDRRG